MAKMKFLYFDNAGDYVAAMTKYDEEFKKNNPEAKNDPIF